MKTKNKSKTTDINVCANSMAYLVQDILDNISHHPFKFNEVENDFKLILKDFKNGEYSEYNK